MEGILSPGIMFVKRTLWPLYIAYNTKAANEDLDYYEKWVGPIFASVATERKERDEIGRAKSAAE